MSSRLSVPGDCLSVCACLHVFFVCFSLMYCLGFDLFFTYILQVAILPQFWLNVEFIVVCSITVLLNVWCEYAAVCYMASFPGSSMQLCHDFCTALLLVVHYE